MSTTVYTYNDKVLVNSANDKWLKKPTVLPPIPANTVRVKTSNGYPPNGGEYASYDTATLVEGTTDIYDVYKSGTSFEALLSHSTNIVEVLGANTAGITSMLEIFYECTSLTSVALFNTSTVTNMAGMFAMCSALTSIPLFDTSSCTNIDGAFYDCTNVESGALALYQQASTQSTVPSSHNGTFRNCGSDTQTGSAELHQIPTSWGGAGPE